MTIILGAVNTGTNLHGSINAGPYVYDQKVQHFFGVEGEYHLLGKLHGRDLSCWLMLYGFATHKLVQAGVAALNNLILENGTLKVTIATSTFEFNDTVFLGFTPEEDPWYDGAGVNGWHVKGTMKFRQATKQE